MGEFMKIISVLIMGVLIFTCFEILTASQSILDAVSFSLYIFKNNIFPSLFIVILLVNFKKETSTLMRMKLLKLKNIHLMNLMS